MATNRPRSVGNNRPLITSAVCLSGTSANMTMKVIGGHFRVF
jgi:hypothetical protein